VYLSRVRQGRTPIFWTGLIAVIFMTIGVALRADDKPVAARGYRLVPVQATNGKTVYVQVKDVNSSTSLPSSHKMFSTTSSMANKTFSMPLNSTVKADSDFKNRDQTTFITKAYLDDTVSPSAPNLGNKAFPTTSAYSRSANGFDKSYQTSSADTGFSRKAVLASSTVSDDQNRTAVLGGPEKPEVFASNSMSNKQYLGPGAQKVPEGVFIKDNIILTRMSGLPDRPLSIDEVRNLINHGFKPNTDVKPEESSKPLNDPNYKPEPLRDMPAPSSDDDKNDPVPPPGTMATPRSPENSEPLPQP